jgi:MFS family permease
VSTATYDIQRGGLRSRLIQILAAIVITSVLAAGVASIAAFDRAVEPELANRTRLIGSIVRAELQRTLELGIPLDAIGGLDRYLAETLAKFQEVERIAVTTASGDVIAAIENTGRSLSALEEVGLGSAIALRQSAFVLPILEGNRLVGAISIEISPLFVQTRLRDVFFDVLVIALVATLVALELALAVTVSSVGKPIERISRLLAEQREGTFLHRIRPEGLGGLARTAARLNDRAEDLAERLTALPAHLRARAIATVDARIAEGRPLRLRLSDISDIRLPLFFYSVSTEIAAAFLPLYARAASRPEWLSPEVAAAAPLVLYLLAVAALSPFAGPLARRFGPRRLFLVSVPPSVLALAALGFSDSVAAITLWRGVMAVFYATATIACQEYALRAAPDHGSARPLGTFVIVVYGGVFCGSALGGVIAGRFGFETTFLVGALLAALSGCLGFAVMRSRAGDRAAAAAPSPVRFKAREGFDLRFLALLVGIVMPMNAATAVFIWYLTPIALAAAGSGPAEIARVVMLYYLAVVLFAPKISGLSDGRVGPLPLVLLGALASAGALLSLALWSGFWAITAAVAALGVAHTLMRAPLYALVARITGGRGVNALRLVERIGAILGLAASALLLGEIGAPSSIAALGVIVLSGLALYVIVEVTRRLRAG